MYPMIFMADTEGCGGRALAELPLISELDGTAVPMGLVAGRGGGHGEGGVGPFCRRRRRLALLGTPPPREGLRGAIKCLSAVEKEGEEGDRTGISEGELVMTSSGLLLSAGGSAFKGASGGGS